MAYDVRILNISEVYLPDDLGQFKPHKRVSYKVGNDGPFTEDFPAAGFNATVAKLKLDERARELQQLRGA